jgi:hypothetical protein
MTPAAWAALVGAPGAADQQRPPEPVGDRLRQRRQQVHVVLGEPSLAGIPEQVRGWLDHTGWRFADHRPLVGPQSLIVAQAA